MGSQRRSRRCVGFADEMAEERPAAFHHQCDVVETLGLVVVHGCPSLMGRNQSGSVRAVVIFSLSDFFLPIGVVAVFHVAFFGKNKQFGEE